MSGAARIVAWLLVVGATTLGCSPAPGTGAPAPEGDHAPLKVLSVHLPLHEFAERIGGDVIEARFPIPPGEDPAFWRPDATAMAEYQEADVILTNGAGYASWMASASLPLAAVVDTSSAYRDRLIEEPEHTHRHGPDGGTPHAHVAFTTWLDLELAAAQARAVAEALIARRPDLEASVRSGLASLEAELQALDRRLIAAGRRLEGVPLLFSHPVYQYLERRYGLQGRSLHWEPDAEPDYAELTPALQGHAAQWMIWEKPPLPSTRERLSELGIASVVFSPAGDADPTGRGFLEAMRANVETLETLAAAVDGSGAPG